MIGKSAVQGSYALISSKGGSHAKHREYARADRKGRQPLYHRPSRPLRARAQPPRRLPALLAGVHVGMHPLRCGGRTACCLAGDVHRLRHVRHRLPHVLLGSAPSQRHRDDRALPRRPGRVRGHRHHRLRADALAGKRPLRRRCGRRRGMPRARGGVAAHAFAERGSVRGARPRHLRHLRTRKRLEDAARRACNRGNPA